MSLFSSFSPMMVWLILGAILILLEMLVPGVFLFWLGIAALIVGALLHFFTFSVMMQILLFAILSIITVLIGIKTYKRGEKDIRSQDPNQVRGAEYIGKIYTITTAVEEGEGRLPLGDSVWRIAGENIPAGSKIRITKVTGNTLNYERVE
ncbi:NfeD family protein [Ignatzschineria ureiclastica]|uniref:NfeD family protein n=1 Tax=Ignatzschineria ureiclastica TaxID=472582 RepID=A0A2U2AHK5_9GAMM|nr:NfeD family protein [Ignatzschineria ureiclastica]PWD82121.1 NfeD family protein [Ignatzschineria ureiclastica]GGZ92799.1 membrane protein [Ignatzschineria ureiclastica]